MPVYAAFAAVYAITCGIPNTDAIDAIKIDRPFFAAIIPGKRPTQPANDPITCVFSKLSISASPGLQQRRLLSYDCPHWLTNIVRRPAHHFLFTLFHQLSAAA